MSNLIEISVCICTFKREHVLNTVRSIFSQQGMMGRPYEVIVTDDDPERSAEALVTEAAAQATAPVRYVFSGAGNVSAARNACLDAARGTWIAFIDDDEIANPNWLRALLDVQKAFHADVVKGYVSAVYPPTTPAWIREADPYTRDYGADGAAPSELASGNVLFCRSLIKTFEIRFDPAFGRSGGEDTDFFRHVRRVGAKVVASRSAIVYEIVPPERVSIAYLQRRYRRIGQTEGRCLRLGRSDRPVARSITIAVIATGTFWTYPIFRVFGSRVRFRVFLKFWYSLGVLEGLAGRSFEEMT